MNLKYNFTESAYNTGWNDAIDKVVSILRVGDDLKSEPPKMAHWIDNGYAGQVCSNCGKLYHGHKFKPFCNNCGAEMQKRG